MKNEVITIQTNIGLLTYLTYRRKNKKEIKTNHQLKHQLNIKQALFNQHFTYYHPEMDFTGLNIISDNRELPNYLIKTKAMTMDQILDKFHISESEIKSIQAIVK
ncbi:MAG TPA: hypothetical protein VEA37_11150 [Flavobacterium sp.]|nr:hypothetical protein [Flavobacterium sp.]